MSQMLQIIGALGFMAAVLGGANPSQAADRCRSGDWTPYSRVRASLVRQSDGDTIEVRARGGTYKVRFLSVDTPETHFQGQSQGRWGEAAKLRTAELPYDFRTRLSGREEARYVGDLERPGEVLPFARRGEISVARRVLFLSDADVTAPYGLPR